MEKKPEETNSKVDRHEEEIDFEENDDFKIAEKSLTENEKKEILWSVLKDKKNPQNFSKKKKWDIPEHSSNKRYINKLKKKIKKIDNNQNQLNHAPPENFTPSKDNSVIYNEFNDNTFEGEELIEKDEIYEPISKRRHYTRDGEMIHPASNCCLKFLYYIKEVFSFCDFLGYNHINEEGSVNTNIPFSSI